MVYETVDVYYACYSQEAAILREEDGLLVLLEQQHLLPPGRGIMLLSSSSHTGGRVKSQKLKIFHPSKTAHSHHQKQHEKAKSEKAERFLITE